MKMKDVIIQGVCRKCGAYYCEVAEENCHINPYKALFPFFMEPCEFCGCNPNWSIAQEYYNNEGTMLIKDFSNYLPSFIPDRKFERQTDISTVVLEEDTEEEIIIDVDEDDEITEKRIIL